MLKPIRAIVVCMAVTLGILNLFAQQGTNTIQNREIKPAPIPVQILEAKKVFISNLGDEIDPVGDLFGGGPNRYYNQFYAAIKNLKTYELVSAPGDADLVLGIKTIPMHVFFAEQMPRLAAFKLTISDPKTNTVLWTLLEPIRGAIRIANRANNLNQAFEKLVDDLQKLATTPAVKEAEKGSTR